MSSPKTHWIEKNKVLNCIIVIATGREDVEFKYLWLEK